VGLKSFKQIHRSPPTGPRGAATQFSR
jgi:hypothetical protein